MYLRSMALRVAVVLNLLCMVIGAGFTTHSAFACEICSSEGSTALTRQGRFRCARSSLHPVQCRLHTERSITCKIRYSYCLTPRFAGITAICRAFSCRWYTRETTHANYSTLLRANLGYMYAGAPYPDYLYTCGNNHDDGESTHWPPWQAAAAKYIRSVYPSPRNATGDRVVAFMFGVVSHYIADVNWHGMVQVPVGYGMIESTGGMDYGCTGGIGDPCQSEAHSLCDTGGEFTASYQTTLFWDDPDSWQIPVNDLLGIYREANITDVNASAIEVRYL